jgi:hypothetical protein
MVDDTDKEFADCRALFETEELRSAFNQKIKQLLARHGIDYTRGYVAALRDILPK